MNEKESVSETITDDKKKNSSSRKWKADTSQPSAADRVMFLQGTIGNQAVGNMIRSGTFHIRQTGNYPQIQRDGDHSTILSATDKYLHTLGHAGTTQHAWESKLVNNAAFMGMRITGGIHKELADRLTQAENFLRTKPENSGLSDDEIASGIGLYSISGRRAPGIAVSGERISYHAFGLAIDVNYRGNPFIGRNQNVVNIIKRATDLIYGRQINIGAAPGRLSLEQLRARYQEASDALTTYFSFLNLDRSALAAHLSERGLPAENNDVDQWLRRIRSDFNDPALRNEFAGRDRAAGFIDLSADLVEAIGRQAGLLWGGQYDGGKDLMHFDWRGGTIRHSHRI